MKLMMLLLMVVCCVGCSSLKAIKSNYATMVNLSDGVSIAEAKLVAQNEIIKVYEQRDYRITAPDIITRQEALEYPDFWFVTFGHNWFSPMSKDPLAKTYTELRETEYVVVIDKKTGDIKFSGEWFPKRDSTFYWVFHPEAYRLKEPLALAPYSVGHKISGY